MVTYEISITSPGQYDNMICEIEFFNSQRIVISNEVFEGDYNITMFNLAEGQSENFSYGKRAPSEEIPVEMVLEAINKGIAELKRIGFDETRLAH